MAAACGANKLSSPWSKAETSFDGYTSRDTNSVTPSFPVNVKVAMISSGKGAIVRRNPSRAFPRRQWAVGDFSGDGYPA